MTLRLVIFSWLLMSGHLPAFATPVVNNEKIEHLLLLCEGDLNSSYIIKDFNSHQACSIQRTFKGESETTSVSHCHFSVIYNRFTFGAQAAEPGYATIRGQLDYTHETHAYDGYMEIEFDKSPKKLTEKLSCILFD